jgi:dihydroxyacetone kinase DhaKLM complex PTS-EIIA-like component DhaM
MDPHSRDASITQADVAYALLVLRAIIGRSLPSDGWAEVGRSVTALMTALVSGDEGALRYETTRLELLSPERGPAALISDQAVDVSAPSAVRARALAAVEILEGVLPVTIYLSDGADHESVESAVEQVLDSLGLYVVGREDPVVGSWFRRMLASARSLATNDPVASLVHGADARYLQRQDAENTALLMQNLGPLIASLTSTKDAVVRVGAFLVVKVDWVLVVTQLTAQQQLTLDHSPQLAAAPQKILHILGLQAAESVPDFPEGNPAD